MSGQKRAVQPSSEVEEVEEDEPRRKKGRLVSIGTFEKWQKDFDRKCDTLTWLRCDRSKSDDSLVETLWCEVCRRFEVNIKSLKNFSHAWLEGSRNQKTSNVRDHASSEQHRAAMNRLKKTKAQSSGLSVTSYSTIAQSLLTMSQADKEKMRKKFDICYIMAKEGLAFSKYPALIELELHHKVDLGFSYKNPPAAKQFTHFIAESQREDFMSALSSVPFFSFLMDGSTDEGNVEQEVFALQYCCADKSSLEISSACRFFAIRSPEKCDSDGLIRCLSSALQPLGIENIMNPQLVLHVQEKPILIGGMTDGAAVNIAQRNGMRGKLQDKLPWLFWGWCYAHRLELACKDALACPLFKEIEEMLLRLFYLYHKSPKKCRELQAIADVLKSAFDTPEGRSVPVRSQGSRWITHKKKALQQFIDRYGVYIAHLSTLAEDSTTKSTDRAKIKGYVMKWSRSKYLLAIGMYIDILKPVSTLSLSLQEDTVDIVQGIQNILKSSKALRLLAKNSPRLWQTSKYILDRLVTEENGETTYQNATLKNFNESVIDQCEKAASEGLHNVDEAMRTRLEWTDTKLLRCVLAILDTRGWARKTMSIVGSDDESDEDDMSEIREAAEHLFSEFAMPLEARGASALVVLEEIEEAVRYARRYLDLGATEYKKVWYKLHTCTDAKRWPCVILLSQLLFSLPFTNCRVEQIFSCLKVVKTERRTKLKEDTLEDLLEIKIEGPELSEFLPDKAIALWWSNQNRRANQSERKEYTKRKATSSDNATSTNDTFTLDDWDDWLAD